MSRQLTIAATLSVVAMFAFALFQPHGDAPIGLGDSLHLPIRASSPALPLLNRLLPALQ